MELARIPELRERRATEVEIPASAGVAEMSILLLGAEGRSASR